MSTTPERRTPAEEQAPLDAGTGTTTMYTAGALASSGAAPQGAAVAPRDSGDAPPGADAPEETEPAGEAGPAGEAEPDETDGPDRTDEPDGTDKPEPDKPKADEPKADEPPAVPPEPDEPWDRFAPAPEPQPTRTRRGLAAVGRLSAHEWTLASLGGLLLAILMTWPTLRDPLHTIPQDIWDPTLQAWQMAWAGHILTTDPAQLWHGNAFWPDRYSYAFSDSLLGYAPFGMIGDGPVAAVLRYNLVFVLAYALAFVGAYALVRQLGAGRTGAAVAGVAFAYAPWRLAQAGHLHVMSSGGIVLALAMLARGHGFSLRHGYRPERRHAGWALGGWLVATWQMSLGFGIGLPFAYVLGLVVLVVGLSWLVRRIMRQPRRPFGLRLLGADVGGGLVFGGVTLLLALPYLKVAELHPYAKRSPKEVAFYSSPLRGFLTAPAESWLWGSRHADARAALPWHPEMTLLLGYILLGLAVAGLIFSIWRLPVRLLLAGGVVVSVALSMGTQFGADGRPGYMNLYDVLPGWNGIRTPGRLVLWTTLLLGILAAGAVSAFVRRAGEVTADRVPNRPGAWLRFATLIPLVLVLVEGVNQTPHPVVPPAPVALASLDGPVLVLPADQGVDQNVMIWSTAGFPKVVNGSSGFIPATTQRTRQTTASFPDPESVAYLRELGVRTVVLLPERAIGTPWERAVNAPVDGLGISREEVGGQVIFGLTG